MLYNTRGVSLIVAIFIIVVIAFMGVMLLTMVGTSTFTSVNDAQSTQALSIAEGGVEYEQRILAQNVDWYRSPDPVDTTSPNLGGGSFIAVTNIPATKLKKRLLPGKTPATVYSTNRFPPSGSLQIGDDFTVDAEIVQYTAVGVGTFTLVVSSVTITHPRGSNVYPVTKLSQALPANCSSPTSFIIAANAIPANNKFLSGGTLDIEGEEILYTGSSLSGVTMTVTGVQRCQDAASQTTPPSHALNARVTPVLANGESAHYQAEITSTATVGAAMRVVKKTVQR